MKTLKQSDINHLQKLLGWVECLIGQDESQVVELAKNLAPKLIEIGKDPSEVKDVFIDDLKRSQQTPLYVRAAVKTLRKIIIDDREVAEGEFYVEDIKRLTNDTTE
jgi:hypothetical protein